MGGICCRAAVTVGEARDVQDRSLLRSPPGPAKWRLPGPARDGQSEHLAGSTGLRGAALPDPRARAAFSVPRMTALVVVLLDSDVAADVDASICRRATVSAFAEDWLDAEGAIGPGVAAPHDDRRRAGSDCLCPQAATWSGFAGLAVMAALRRKRKLHGLVRTVPTVLSFRETRRQLWMLGAPCSRIAQAAITAGLACSCSRGSRSSGARDRSAAAQDQPCH